MSARLLLATLLILTGTACEKEIHEVRFGQAPEQTLASADASATEHR